MLLGHQLRRGRATDTRSAGYTSGYSILDSGRAVIEYMNWPSDAKMGMTGYSEGAHATVWASNLHPSYAPEVNIVRVLLLLRLACCVC